MIYDTGFHSIAPNQRVNGRVDVANTKTEPVIIDDYVFIGAHVTVVKGVTIGRCAVIGASPVITRDVPTGEIWAGNPARPINKIGINPCEIQIHDACC